MLRFHRTMIYLTIVFLLRIRSQMLCAQWTCHVLQTRLSHSPYHMPPARVLVRSCSCFTCFLTCTNMDCRLVSLRFLITSVSFCLVNLSAYISRLCLSSFLSRRLVCRLVISRTMTHSPVYSSCVSLQTFVLVSSYAQVVSLYIRVGDGDPFPIFNLLCNHPKGATCEIPCTLLVLSSSLAKATASRFLRSHSPLSTRLPVVKSSLRSVLRCAHNSLQ